MEHGVSYNIVCTRNNSFNGGVDIADYTHRMPGVYATSYPGPTVRRIERNIKQVESMIGNRIKQVESKIGSHIKLIESKNNKSISIFENYTKEHFVKVSGLPVCVTCKTCGGEWPMLGGYTDPATSFSYERGDS